MGLFAVSYLIAFAAGVSFVFQQAVNANLRVEIGSPWWAGFVSYLGGTIIMLIAALALREPIPDVTVAARSQGISWTGGLFGAIYIAISILLLPRLGAASVIALIVAGQMIGSLAFDHFGLFGLTVHHITAPRVAGALFLLTGVVLVRY
jgi:bacterial/archaeal transporter family-2 protein